MLIEEVDDEPLENVAKIHNVALCSVQRFLLHIENLRRNCMSGHSKDMELIIPKGCDNAPRKQIVIDFTIGVLTSQGSVIEDYSHEDIVWNDLKEQKETAGRDALLDNLNNESDEIDTLEVYQIITHGKFASINGLITLSDGSKIDFCDVYTFSSAAKSGKVKEVKSYRL